MSHRLERLGDQLHRELAAILQRDLKDPRVRLATVASVSLSRDLSHAVVRVSVLGEDEDRELAMRGLRRARGFIRTLLARRLRARTVPELAFKLDRGAEHSQRISEILESLHGDANTS